MSGQWTLRAWKASGALLVALALVVRVVTPAGWMFADDGRGAPRLVICTGHLGGPPATPGQPASGDHRDYPCAFADAHHAVAPPPLIEVRFAAYAAPIAQEQRLRGDQRPGLGLAAPPPPSLGPPSFV